MKKHRITGEFAFLISTSVSNKSRMFSSPIYLPFRQYVCESDMIEDKTGLFQLAIYFVAIL